MNDDYQALIDGYLDDVLSTEEFARVNALAKESPEFARHCCARPNVAIECRFCGSAPKPAMVALPLYR